eukprot:3932915-Rhodomonas_salina.4
MSRGHGRTLSGLHETTARTAGMRDSLGKSCTVPVMPASKLASKEDCHSIRLPAARAGARSVA